jgi:hypothetical protein
MKIYIFKIKIFSLLINLFNLNFIKIEHKICFKKENNS